MEDKKNIRILLKIYFSSLIIFVIVFYKEPIISTIRITLAIAVMTYVPGYLLTKRIFEQNSQRLLFGSAISIIIIGISAYYLGLIGIQLQISAFMLPLTLILTGIIINYRTK